MADIISYKQVTEEFRSIAQSHMAVKRFQVGATTDIDIQTDEMPFQRFPLVHMTPRTLSMDRFGKTVFGFTFIVADIAKDNDQFLRIDTQNNCAMIAQDIFSKIILSSWQDVDLELETPLRGTFFTEAFNNNLSGVSFEINVLAASPFDLCSAAFES